ncbi:MAG: hypothetical protein HIU86_01360 [Acidobacteria bacterium]|nr:hypothetical protein [Acidobacteriota bacterium]
MLLADIALSVRGGPRDATGWRFVVAALPLLPAGAGVVVALLRARRLDGYQLALLLPGVVGGSGTTMVVGALASEDLLGAPIEHLLPPTGGCREVAPRS